MVPVKDDVNWWLQGFLPSNVIPHLNSNFGRIGTGWDRTTVRVPMKGINQITALVGEIYDQFRFTVVGCWVSGVG